MSEQDQQQLQNLAIIVKAGARVLSNQEQDNEKAANLLLAGENLVKWVVALVNRATERETKSPELDKVE